MQRAGSGRQSRSPCTVSCCTGTGCGNPSADGNGKVLFSGLKRKGDTLDQGGKPPLTLRLGFARGAQVAYNGQPVDVAPFTSGETARLKLGQ